jgi:type I restriction enzyme S subunit
MNERKTKRKASDNIPYEKKETEVGLYGDKIPFAIPESWEWACVSQVTRRVGTKYNQIPEQNIKSAGSIPAVGQGADLPDGFCDCEDRAITDLPVLLFGDHTRTVKYIDFPFVIRNDGAKCLKVIGLEPRYFYYWMLWEAETMQNRGYARHYSLLTNAMLPVPPLEEQRRIAARLDQLLPLIREYDQAYHALDHLQKTFPERLGRSVLQQAVQGHLVPQDPTDEPADILLERIRAQKQHLVSIGKIRKERHEAAIYRRGQAYYERVDGTERCIDAELPFALPENWRWARLDAILCQITTGKSLNCRDITPEKDQPGIIRVSAVSGGNFQENESKTCLSDSDWTAACQIHQGDFLLCRANTRALVGSCAIVDHISKRLMLSDKILRLNFGNLMDPYYLLYCFQSPALRLQIEASAAGTSESMKSISQHTVKNYLIPIPPLAEQHRIVARIEELFAQTNRL